MEILIPLAIIFLLVVANGLFVAAEFAIVGAPRSSIEHQAAQGSRLAQRVLLVLEDPALQDRYIATTQIGISVASLGLGMYGEHWLANQMQPWFVRFETLGWIAAHTSRQRRRRGGADLPAHRHRRNGSESAGAAAGGQDGSLRLPDRPGNAARHVAARRSAQLGGESPVATGRHRARAKSSESAITRPRNCEFIVRESQEGGMLRGEAGQILRDLFEFGDRTAGEVMVPRVLLAGIPVGAEPDELRAIVRAHAHTRYPVYSGDLDNIIGSLHIKEILRHLVSNQPVAARDARALPYVPGPAQLDEVLAAMRRFRAQMAVVMDQHGGTAGLVTIEDLFEEVVGEIDEGRARRPIVREADGRIRVRGTVRLDEAGEALGRSIEHEKVTTISGLVLLLLNRPASVGDVVTWRNVRIEVVSVAGRGVGEAMLSVAGALSR